MTEVLSLLEEIAFGRMDNRLSEYLIQKFRTAEEGENVIYITHEQAAAAKDRCQTGPQHCGYNDGYLRDHDLLRIEIDPAGHLKESTLIFR